MESVAPLIEVLILLVLLGAGFIALIARRDKRIAREQLEARAASLLPSNYPIPTSPPRLKFSAFDLQPRRTYRVAVAFSDYDKTRHEVGERWTFLGKAFLPYEDGLSLFL